MLMYNMNNVAFDIYCHSLYVDAILGNIRIVYYMKLHSGYLLLAMGDPHITDIALKYCIPFRSFVRSMPISENKKFGFSLALDQIYDSRSI